MESITAASSSTVAKPPSGDAFQNLEMEDFLKLMVAELQNQDPLNPADNTQILQQISQMREIVASDSLTETLESVLLGQNVSSASNMIGKFVEAIDDIGNPVSGIVESITIHDGEPRINIGSQQVALSNVREIRAENQAEAAEATTEKVSEEVPEEAAETTPPNDNKATTNPASQAAIASRAAKATGAPGNSGTASTRSARSAAQ